MGNPIWIDKDILRSKAFMSLKTATSIRLFFDFFQKRQMKQRKHSKRKSEWVITNNGKIEFTYSEAVKRGYSRAAFARAIDDLIDRGLIDLVRQGGSYEGEKNLFAISERWRDFGTDNFKKKQRQKNTRNGQGFSAMHARNKQLEERKNRHNDPNQQKPKLKRRPRNFK